MTGNVTDAFGNVYRCLDLCDGEPDLARIDHYSAGDRTERRPACGVHDYRRPLHRPAMSSATCTSTGATAHPRISALFRAAPRSRTSTRTPVQFPVSATLTDTVGNSSTVGSSVTVVADRRADHHHHSVNAVGRPPGDGYVHDPGHDARPGVGVRDAVINFGDGTVTDLGGLSEQNDCSAHVYGRRSVSCIAHGHRQPWPQDHWVDIGDDLVRAGGCLARRRLSALVWWRRDRGRRQRAAGIRWSNRAQRGSEFTCALHVPRFDPVIGVPLSSGNVMSCLEDSAACRSRTASSNPTLRISCHRSRSRPSRS